MEFPKYKLAESSLSAREIAKHLQEKQCKRLKQLKSIDAQLSGVTQPDGVDRVATILNLKFNDENANRRQNSVERRNFFSRHSIYEFHVCTHDTGGTRIWCPASIDRIWRSPDGVIRIRITWQPDLLASEMEYKMMTGFVETNGYQVSFITYNLSVDSPSY
jgi:hypothetical protein